MPQVDPYHAALVRCVAAMETGTANARGPDAAFVARVQPADGAELADAIARLHAEAQQLRAAGTALAQAAEAGDRRALLEALAAWRALPPPQPPSPRRRPRG